MKRRVHLDSSIVILFFIVVVIAFTTAFIYREVRGDTITRLVEADEDFNVLVTVSQGEGAEKQLLSSHVLMYAPLTGRAALFHVPGKTGAILPSLGRTDRIEEIYRQEGVDAYRSTVEDLLGAEVPHYLSLSVDGLEALVDTLGGVQLFLPTSVDQYVSPDSVHGTPDSVGTGGAAEAAPARVMLPGGTNRLDGAQAKAYFTLDDSEEFREDAAGRRNEFVRELISEMTRRAVLLSHDEVSALLYRHVETDLDERSYQSLLEELGNLYEESVVVSEVQGAKREVTVAGEERTLLFPHFEGRWLQETVSQVRDSLRSPEAAGEPGRTIEVQVLNGTTEAGLARRTTDLYAGLGTFEMREPANAPHSEFRETIVVDHGGEGGAARRVADVIRAQRIETVDPGQQQGADFEVSEETSQETIPSGDDPDREGPRREGADEPAADEDAIRTVVEAEESQGVDVTVILGEDFDGRYVAQ